MSVAATALEAAVAANHFGVMQVHNLQETMVKKGVACDHECLIFEVRQLYSLSARRINLNHSQIL
ncbi:MAG: hypothetical protein ABI273_12685 [Lacunisphaera sp.]